MSILNPVRAFDRPHPGPLPRERGNRSPGDHKIMALDSRAVLEMNKIETAIAARPSIFQTASASFSLSPGERVGVGTGHRHG